MSATQLIAGRWVEDEAGGVHVSDFGARGDGVANDTVALRTAIQAAGSTHALRWGPGPYLVSDDVSGPNVGGLYTQCVGMVTGAHWSMDPGGTTIKRAAGAKAWNRVVQADGVDRWRIEGRLIIDGNLANIGNFGADGVSAPGAAGKGNEQMHGMFVWSSDDWRIDELTVSDVRGDGLLIGAASEATISSGWTIGAVKSTTAGRKPLTLGTCRGTIDVAELDNTSGGAASYGGTADDTDKHCLDVEPDHVPTVPQGVTISRLHMVGGGLSMSMSTNLADANLWVLSCDTMSLDWSGSTSVRAWLQLGGTINARSIRISGLNGLAISPVLVQYGARVIADEWDLAGTSTVEPLVSFSASVDATLQHPELFVGRLRVDTPGAGGIRLDTTQAEIDRLTLVGCTAAPLNIRETGLTSTGDDHPRVRIGTVDALACSGAYTVVVQKLGGVTPRVDIGGIHAQGASAPTYAAYLTSGAPQGTYLGSISGHSVEVYVDVPADGPPLRPTRTLEGTGSPEGVVTAPVGKTYSRADGGAGTTLYVKESGTGNTGWVAYGAAGVGGLPVYVVDATVATAAPSHTQSFARAGAATSNRVVAWPVAIDDTDELDPVIVTGRVDAAGFVRITITAITGRLAPGVRRVAYSLAS
jgi:hypothetical protein